MFLHLSVILFTGGRHPPQPNTPWADTPPALGRHTPLEMGTEVSGTHPTGMHSCFYAVFGKNFAK